MTLRAQIFALAVAVAGLVFIIWLVRRGRLKERFALLWIAIGVGMIATVAVRSLLDRSSEFLGIRAGTTLLFLLAIVFLLALILHVSVIISGLEEKVRDLAQASALHEVEHQDSSAEPQPPIDTSDDG